MSWEKLLEHARRQCAAASGTDFLGSRVSQQVEQARLVIQEWRAGHQIDGAGRGMEEKTRHLYNLRGGKDFLGQQNQEP